MTPPSLRELQSWMKWVIADPRGVKIALDSSSPEEPQPRALPWIQQCSAKSALQRLDVYAEAYFLRILDALREDFPRTVSILGESFFKNLIATYLKEHPSKTYNINEVGEHLPVFASQLAFCDEFPFLPSLMELEWQINRQTWLPSPPSQTRVSLEALGNANLEALFIVLNPSLQILMSSWPLDEMWTPLTEKNFLPLGSETDFILFRNSLGPQIQRLSKPQIVVLNLILEKNAFADIVEIYQETFPNNDVRDIITWFQNWAQHQVICDFEMKSPEIA
ncbi:MAG: HvfC/BufC family peptide modification chaperone [Pseudobdellovibrionaceae bacterium]